MLGAGLLDAVPGATSDGEGWPDGAGETAGAAGVPSAPAVGVHPAPLRTTIARTAVKVMARTAAIIMWTSVRRSNTRRIPLGGVGRIARG